ncbi:MAG TPA: EAL domain-containing protein [Caulobacteraceae bacterium]|nr:EAL domain-containing protein [Caulobacteraceae bacterium]
MLGRGRSATDWLALVSVGAIASFVTVLCFVAARDPDARTLIAPVVVGLGAGGLILFRQLRKAASSLAASEQRAVFAATHDPLTGLPNRALFAERVAEAVNNDAAGASAIFCIGLDRFDELAELIGSAASDALMVALAGRLTSLCGPRDTPSRIGDSTFALLRRDGQGENPLSFAARLIETLTPPSPKDDAAFVSCSVGASFVIPEAKVELEGLREAQIALSSSRDLGGRHAMLFQPEMDQALKHRKSLEADLRQALADDDLFLLYQPQVNAKGAIVGVEALVRWTSPTRGEVSPAIFVPLAERCGLIEALGRFALRRALRDSVAWPGVTIAINVAAAQIKSGMLVRDLKTVTAECGRAAQGVDLEITESVLLADDPATLETLSTIRKLGFSITLDDFGTGYSSLSYLRRFPVDKIKIDQSFIRQLGRRPESSAIVKAIVELAEALELKVLAEGVETRDQVDRLGRLGCHLYQGFYFSEPLSAEALGQLVARGTPLAA